MKPHISHQYDAELEGVRNRTLAMGGLVEQQLADALAAMAERDVEAAQDVVSGDYRVNAAEVAIDEDCIQLLARRQPAASDLRLVVTVLKVITELERIGDDAESVGRIVLMQERDATNHLSQLEHMGRRVQEMLHRTLDAFARWDTEVAAEVAQEDLKVDRDYEAVIRQMTTYMMESPRSIPAVVNVLYAARALERVGDRARNICEYLIYLVKGKDVRHTGLNVMLEAASPKPKPGGGA